MTENGIQQLKTGRIIPVSELLLLWYNPPCETFSEILFEFTEALYAGQIYHGLDDSETIVNIEPPKKKVARKVPPKWVSIRWQIFRRDGFYCRICRKSAMDGAELEVDHKKSLAHDGTWDLDNLWTTCKDCNRGKRTDDI